MTRQEQRADAERAYRQATLVRNQAERAWLDNPLAHGTQQALLVASKALVRAWDALVDAQRAERVQA